LAILKQGGIMIEKTSIIESITITEDMTIVVSEKISFTEDGVVIGGASRTSKSIAPGDSVTGENSLIVAVVGVVHTGEVIADYQQKKAARKMGYRE